MPPRCVRRTTCSASSVRANRDRERTATLPPGDTLDNYFDDFFGVEVEPSESAQKAWDEAKHKRNHGKFSSTGGDGSSGKQAHEEHRKARQQAHAHAAKKGGYDYEPFRGGHHLHGEVEGDHHLDAHVERNGKGGHSMTLTTTNYGKKTFGKPEQHQTVRDYPDEHQAMKAAHGNMRAFIGKKGPSDRSAQAQHQAKPHATESHKRSLANLGKKPTRAAEHTTVLNENRLRKHQPGRKFNAGDLSSSPVNKYTGKTSAQELADAKLRGHKFPRGKSYEEGKHPRAQGGKWTGGSGEGSDGGRASTSEHRHEPIKTSPPDNREGDHSKKMDAQYHAEMSKAPKKDDFFKPAGKASGTIHNDPDPVEPDGKLSRMDGKKGGKGGFRATGATPTIKRKPTGKNGIQPLKKKKP